MGKTKRLLLTLCSSGIATIISFAISFLLTPYITNRVGADAYGFVTLSKNFTGYAMIAVTALNSYAARFISVEYHNNNINRASEFMSSVVWGNVLIAGTISVLMIIVSFTALEYIVEIPQNVRSSVSLLFVFSFLNFFLTVIGENYNVYGYIKNRLDISGFIRTFCYIIQVMFLFILFGYFGAEIWVVGAALLISTCFVYLAHRFFYNRIVPEIIISRKKVNVSSIKILVGNGIWNSVNSLGNVLNSGLDLWVSNILLSPLEMGYIAISKTITSVFSSMNSLFAQPFYPLFLKSYSEGNKDELYREFSYSMKLSGFIGNLAFSSFICFGKIFFDLWLPGQNTDVLYRLTLIAGVSHVFEASVYPLYYIYTLTVKNKIPCIITVISGLLNVISMFFLIKYTNVGIYAVVITTSVLMSIISLVTNPIYMSYCLNERLGLFYKPIVRNILSCILMCIIFMIPRLFLSNSWVSLFATGIICTIIGIVVHYIVALNESEKITTKKRISSFLGVKNIDEQ